MNSGDTGYVYKGCELECPCAARPEMGTPLLSSRASRRDRGKVWMRVGGLSRGQWPPAAMAPLTWGQGVEEGARKGAALSPFT